MAAYNPLSYFSFGKKKEEGASLSNPNTEPETAAAGSTERSHVRRWRSVAPCSAIAAKCPALP